jgi:hypothetical protein
MQLQKPLLSGRGVTEKGHGRRKGRSTFLEFGGGGQSELLEERGRRATSDLNLKGRALGSLGEESALGPTRTGWLARSSCAKSEHDGA